MTSSSVLPEVLPTPRTDAILWQEWGSAGIGDPVAECMRTLERELQRKDELLREALKDRDGALAQAIATAEANRQAHIQAEELQRRLDAEQRRSDAFLRYGDHEAELRRAAEQRVRESGNYVADKEIEPTQVTFANGRIVRSVGGYLVVE